LALDRRELRERRVERAAPDRAPDALRALAQVVDGQRERHRRLNRALLADEIAAIEGEENLATQLSERKAHPAT
jgi:hypothetical protein